jgi:hypothetical protein
MSGPRAHRLTAAGALFMLLAGSRSADGHVEAFE